MKKTAAAVVLMGMGILVFAQSAKTGSGVIKELTGTVELKSAGAADYAPAKAGDEVAQSTVISTGLKSTALVEVGSTVIAVRPLTRLTLTEISASAGTENLNVNLQAGRVRVDVTPPAGTRAAMAVSSPSATASVRGTSFYFDTRNLHVTHGTVLFKGNRGYTVQINSGSTGIVTWKGSASTPESGGFAPLASVGRDPSAGNTGGSGALISGGSEAPAPSPGPGNPDPGPNTPNTPNTPNNPSGPITPPNNPPYYPNTPPGFPSSPGSGGSGSGGLGISY